MRVTSSARQVAATFGNSDVLDGAQPVEAELAGEGGVAPDGNAEARAVLDGGHRVLLVMEFLHSPEFIRSRPSASPAPKFGADLAQIWRRFPFWRQTELRSGEPIACCTKEFWSG